MSLNINIDIKKLIKLIFTLILICIIIYFLVKIIRKVFCKKSYLNLPPDMLLLSSSDNDLAYYTISSSSLF